MIKAFFEYQFLQNALIASLLASVVCGVIGVIVIEKKLVMLSGAIAHTSYGGVGLGYLLGFPPIIGAFLFAVCAAFGIGFVKRRGDSRSDIVISILWSLGMALGVLFIAVTPGYPPDLNSYLFGNILSVTKPDLYIMAASAVVIVLIISVFFNDWKTYLFDNEFAVIIGIKTAFLEYLLLILIAVTVVVLIRVVGIILVIALLTAPAGTVSLFTFDLKKRMIYSVLLSGIICALGLFISYALNIASASVIVIISVLFYLFAYAINSVKSKHKAL